MAKPGNDPQALQSVARSVLEKLKRFRSDVRNLSVYLPGSGSTVTVLDCPLNSANLAV
jgi:hypothetical protein